jgi:hypothetical protein
MEAVHLLLEATTCEALPRIAVKETGNGPAWQEEMQNAHDCRQELAQKGIDDSSRLWLARLHTTRRIMVVPTANALGYYQKTRTENGIDPNRDFNYDLLDSSQCMQTIAGRTLNEVFREHMFQLSLTFHAGVEVIGYEWGSPTWNVKWGIKSPDDTAQVGIAAAYSKYAGGWDGDFQKTQPYRYGKYVLIVVAGKADSTSIFASFLTTCLYWYVMLLIV